MPQDSKALVEAIPGSGSRRAAMNPRGIRVDLLYNQIHTVESAWNRREKRRDDCCSNHNWDDEVG